MKKEGGTGQHVRMTGTEDYSQIFLKLSLSARYPAVDWEGYEIGE